MVPSFRGSQSLSAARRGGGTDYAGSSSPDKRKNSGTPSNYKDAPARPAIKENLLKVNYFRVTGC